MAALADCLQDLGCEVSGSDLRSSPTTARLATRGIRIFQRHNAANLANAELVVISDAIPLANVEVKEARTREIPLVRRAEMLNRIAARKSAVMISGSHGKSTITAMLATVLDAVGREPSFAAGADIPALGGVRARFSRGSEFVAEACEAFRNLSAYHADIAVISNIDLEHVEHYGGADRLDTAFIEFANGARTATVVNGDDPGVRRIIPRLVSPVTFGVDPANMFSATNLALGPQGASFDLRMSGQVVGHVDLSVAGRHQILNALACIAVAATIGLAFEAVASGLRRYTGISRRWQLHDTKSGIRLYDDFAHHPTELEALAALTRDSTPVGGRCVIAFQPQLYSRTKALLAEFAQALARFDLVLLLDIDGAGEVETGEVSSVDLAAAIRAVGTEVVTIGTVEDLVQRIGDVVCRDDVLVTAGAGSIAGAAERIAATLPPAETKTPSEPRLDRQASAQLQGIADAMESGASSDTVLRFLAANVARDPTAPAVSDGRKVLSFAELEQQSRRLAGQLAAQGLAGGHTAGVRMSLSIDLIVVVVALAKLGVVYLPLDSSLPAERVEFMLRDAGARIMVVARKLVSDRTDGVSVVVLEELTSIPAEEQFAGDPVAGHDIAYVCYTSGSTGRPKGVAVSHSSLLNFAMDACGRFGVGPGARMILNTSIGFDVSLGEIWMTLCGGGELRATGSTRPLVGSALREFLHTHEITHTAITPTVLQSLPESKLPALGCIISAGEACPPSLVGRWAAGRRFFNAYGPTEATIYATAGECRAGETVTIGIPLGGTSIRLLDDQLREVAEGGVGELCIGGAGVAAGYIGLPVETASRFVEWRDEERQVQRLYRSGDLASRGEDGRFTYLGRIDNQVKILGNRVELEEIEQALLLRVPALLDVVVAFDDGPSAGHLVCIAVAREEELDWEAARVDLERWLPSHMIPVDCSIVPRIKTTASGKKDRAALLTEYRRTRVRRTEYHAPRTVHEIALAAIWKSVLALETDIGVDERFSWLGGDSLKALQIVMEVELAFGLTIPPAYFGSLSTVQHMAIQLGDLLWRKDSAVQDPGFSSSRVYRQLREITASWPGHRAQSGSLIVSTGSPSPLYEFFICVQIKDELHGFADALGEDFRVHGMRSGDMIMEYTPDAVEALCTQYADEIAAMEPRGSLLVGGICQGATIATRLEQILRQRGHDVQLLVLIEQTKIVPVDSPVAYFFSEDSHANPFRRFTAPRSRFDDVHRKAYTIDLVPGAHGTIHASPQVQIFAHKLRARLANKNTSQDQSVGDDVRVLSPPALPKQAQDQEPLNAPAPTRSRIGLEWLLGRRRPTARRPPKTGWGGPIMGRLPAVSEEEVRDIAASAFFDAAYYLDEVGGSLGGLSPARHYATIGWRADFDPGPYFSTLGYLLRYPDIRSAGINPFVHYIRHGLFEGRIAWTDEKLAVWQKGMNDRPEIAIAQLQRHPVSRANLRRGDTIEIYAHSEGHFVFRQFQELLAQAFDELGIHAVLATEAFKPDRLAPAATRMVIAPHDFFFLGGPDREPSQFRDAILLNTEQMPSVWFNKALRFLLQAPLVLDLNLQTAACLASLGAKAAFLPLGLVPGNQIFQLQPAMVEEPAIRGLPEDMARPPVSLLAPLHDRGIDVLLVGSNSDRRAQFVAEHSAFFASARCFIRLVDVNGPLDHRNPHGIAPRAMAGLAQRSKLLLNVHHFETPYFEWQRLVHYGLMQRCCVVTERSTRVPGLIPGEHYFEAELQALPSLLDWLLNTPDGREAAEKVSLAGYLTATQTFRLSRTLADLFVADGPAL